MDERRARPRVEAKVRVRIVDQDDTTETYTGNLSKSGVFLETLSPVVSEGEKVQLHLWLPNASEAIKISGKVARVARPNQMGVVPGIAVQFLRVETRQARTFEKLIDRLLDVRGIGSRKHPRLKARVVVELKTKEEVREALAQDVSKGGMFIRTAANQYVLGDSLHVVIFHPTTRRKFALDAEVVHVRKGESSVSKEFIEGVGVRFVNYSAARKSDMSSFLRSILAARKS